jgi:hypothetical protein
LDWRAERLGDEIVGRQRTGRDHLVHQRFGILECGQGQFDAIEREMVTLDRQKAGCRAGQYLLLERQKMPNWWTGRAARRGKSVSDI